MEAAIRIFASAVAAAALSCSSTPANASQARAALAKTRLGGLHLGMTQTDFDNMVRSSPNWNEPLNSGDMSNCSDSDLGPAGPPYFRTEVAATDSEDRVYAVKFEMEGVRMEANRINYRSGHLPAPWESHLANAEKRFGKADWVGLDQSHHQALWCSPGEVECTGTNRYGLAGPSLTITFFPNENGQIEAGGILDYDLDRGRLARDAGHNAWNAPLNKADPRQRAALLSHCRNARGGFADHAAIFRHNASLVALRGSTSPVFFSPRVVPPEVFAAIDIDAANTFAKGVCFASGDFIPEDQVGCGAGYTSTGFRWARKLGNTWLLSLKFGGVSLRREYFAVKKYASGNYRKVWWSVDSEGLSSFNAWRAQGAIPMTEPPDVND